MQPIRKERRANLDIAYFLHKHFGSSSLKRRNLEYFVLWDQKVDLILTEFKVSRYFITDLDLDLCNWRNWRGDC